MSQRFANKTVLITGAAGGMGQAFGRRFAQEGAALILTDVEEKGLEEGAATLRSEGAVCTTYRVDLSSENEIQQFASEVANRYPQLDVLVNNAGIAYGEVAHMFETLSQAKWLRFLSVNTVTPLLLAQALRAPLAKAHGAVINVSSMASFVPATAYGVTKAALNAMTYGMANVFGADGIRVNAIAPGVMETPASRAHLPPGTYERVQSQQVLKLEGTAADIAALGAFLASDDARFITCEVLSCDAGNRMGMALISTVPGPTVDFHVEQRGSNPRAVFVHGFGGDLHSWDTLWSALGDDFAALRYDLRGHGASVCRQPTALYDHADDLLTVLDAVGIDRCDLVGVSMGGATALNFTLDHPDRVRSLILISPGVVAWEWSAAWRQLWRALVGLARTGKMDEARRLWWQHPLFSTTRSSAAGPALFDSIMRFAGTQWIQDPHIPMLPDLDRLHLLATRTLLLTGGRDFEDFRVIADLIEASVSELQRFDHSERGHLLHLEDPAGCALKISSFLRENPPFDRPPTSLDP